MQQKNNSQFPEEQKGGILIMDSGIGSLSFLSSLNKLIPNVPLVAFADQAFFPYGEKPENLIVDRILDMAEKLVKICEPSTILIACNTASTIVLPALREKFKIPIVGIVPAIKTAAAISKTKKIALLATKGTVSRTYIDDLVQNFASDCELHKIGSANLAALAESKLSNGVADLAAIRKEIEPILEVIDLDCLILGCTHFTFLEEEIKNIIGHNITIVDPVQPVSAQVARVNTSIKRSNVRNFLLLSRGHSSYSDLDFQSYGISEIIYI